MNTHNSSDDEDIELLPVNDHRDSPKYADEPDEDRDDSNSTLLGSWHYTEPPVTSVKKVWPQVKDIVVEVYSSTSDHQTPYSTTSRAPLHFSWPLLVSCLQERCSTIFLYVAKRHYYP